MKGSEFVQQFGRKSLGTWEAAARDIATTGGLVDWPWHEVALSDGENNAIIKVQADVLSIGTSEDFLRLPLLPSTAQDIFNVFGWLLPTPWLAYQIWRAATIKLTPTPMVPNSGANLAQWAAHNQEIERQVAGRKGLVTGHKKDVIVSNIYQPGKVLIFGWYYPAPDVYDNGLPMNDPKRQPRQPKSNVHGSFYVDYSHGIRAVHPLVRVNGQGMTLVDLYQHPKLCKLVSNEGPVHMPRYPSKVPVLQTPNEVEGTHIVATTPGLSVVGLARMTERGS